MKPKYKVVYDSVKEKIQNGEYQANDQIEDGDTLAGIYDCSVLTVKKALDILVGEGYLVRKRGLGTFVKKIVGAQAGTADRSYGVNQYYTMGRSIIRPNVTSCVETFEVVKSSEELARNLNIEPGDFVYHIIRVRLYDGDPRVVEYTWMPLSVISGLEMKHVEASIYSYITHELKLKIQSAHVSINATRPNDIEKKHFGMDDNDFVCEVVQTAFLDDSEIFEYSIAHHIPKYFEFETTVIKELY